MSKSIKLSDEIIELARQYAKVYSRSVPKQIEHWSKIGKIVEENPELSYNFIKEILLGIEELDQQKVEEYQFDEMH